MTRFSRRTLLRAGATIAGATAIGAPSIGYGLPDKIRIGHLTPLTGFLGTLGAYAQLGIRLAEAEINAAGGVMGRPLDVISEDSVNPTTAATKARRMLDRDGALVLMGEINSASALAIMQVAARNKRLYMQIGGRSDMLRGQACNRYSFHVDIPSTTEVKVVGKALLRDDRLRDKTFSMITADYVFGHDLARAARSFLEANGGRVLGDQLVSTDVTDFQPYLQKMATAKPDFVCVNLVGSQLTNLARQYAELGLPHPIIGFNLNTADVWAAGAGRLSGTWPTVWYHTLDVPASKAFVAAFIKRYGKVPENHAWIEYVSLKMMAQAMAETKSTETEQADRLFRTGDAVRYPEGPPWLFPQSGSPTDAGSLSVHGEKQRRGQDPCQDGRQGRDGQRHPQRAQGSAKRSVRHDGPWRRRSGSQRAAGVDRARHAAEHLFAVTPQAHPRHTMQRG